uniref:Transcription initiation factor IIF subunit beta n=1 Tax=Leptocylindrus danicus TaxID=163516 RepID=A0A7S2L003_9STRA|mmetsp:Transcript_29300/g.43015  ORF Transcript_29300/g.43015 Transcript_29300/m.43015 type:complete len:284 (+) Transcript_29300:34-885(+)
MNDVTTSTTDSKVTISSTQPNYAKVQNKSVSRQIWLAKIPNKLHQAWENAPEGTVLGHFTFTKGGVKDPKTGKVSKDSTKQSLSVQVDESIHKNKEHDLPLSYSIEALTKKVPVLHPFTRDSDGSVVLHGTVARSCNLQIQHSREYSRLLKNRLLSTVNSSRYVKPVDASDVSLARDAAALKAASGADFGSSVARHGQEVIDAKNDAANAGPSKKRKFEGQSLRTILFEMFATQQHWTVKEIRAASGFPDNEVRAALQEMCDFHRSGEHRGSWELKKEYQPQS